MSRTVKARSLREQLEDRKKIIVLPGVFDALSARIARQVGFTAMFQTGYGSSAALLGMPDFGLLNAGETVDNARRIISAVDVPVLVDADTGYGNPLNVWRLVRDLEKLGAAGIFLEDQIWPKRCGHMIGKDVIAKDDYLPKLKAALEARKNRDFIIVARTDARAPLGLDEAIERGKAYRKAGADVVFVEAPRNMRELKRVADEIDGIYRLLMSDWVGPLNIGNPDEMTVMQLAEVILELTGSESPIEIQPLPQDDPQVRRPMIDKARERLLREYSFARLGAALVQFYSVAV